MERLKWAILYGADAVYCGGPTLGMRANTTNFTLEELKEGVLFSHQRGKKVYVTVNVVLHNEGIDTLESYLKSLEEIGVDAIIVQYFADKGVSRIVLGRELSKENIEDIIKHTNIEIETFIHGSMCASYSGRCVLSNFFTGRDANRGGCAQICRWDFALENYKGRYIKGDKPFTFCTKDLSLLKYIPEMIDMGITSFKIEGRMRSVYYCWNL